jgi:hypothetical protein
MVRFRIIKRDVTITSYVQSLPRPVQRDFSWVEHDVSNKILPGEIKRVMCTAARFCEVLKNGCLIILLSKTILNLNCIAQFL